MGFLISTFKPVGEVRNVIQNQKNLHEFIKLQPVFAHLLTGISATCRLQNGTSTNQ